MLKMMIILRSFAEAERFVGICSAYPFNMDLAAENQVVHAKSIIGVLSMPLGTPLELTVAGGEPAAVEEFSAQIAPFILPE